MWACSTQALVEVTGACTEISYEVTTYTLWSTSVIEHVGCKLEIDPEAKKLYTKVTIVAIAVDRTVSNKLWSAGGEH